MNPNCAFLQYYHITPSQNCLKFLIWIQCCFTDDNFNQDSFKVNFQDGTAPKTQSSSKLYKVGDKSLVKSGEPYGKYMKSGVGSSSRFNPPRVAYAREIFSGPAADWSQEKAGFSDYKRNFSATESASRLRIKYSQLMNQNED